MKKRTGSIISVLFVSAALLAGEFKQNTEFEKEIHGEWEAAELFFAQPSTEIVQSIKAISFQTNNIVQWVEITNSLFSIALLRDGKMQTKTGCYDIYSFTTGTRKLPRLSVAPTNYPKAVESSHLLLTISELELDFDCRFPQRLGKLLKGSGPDGRRVLFLRKGSEFNSQHSPASGVLNADTRRDELIAMLNKPTDVSELTRYELEGKLIYYIGTSFQKPTLVSKDSFDRIKTNMTIEQLVDTLGPGFSHNDVGVAFIAWRSEDGRELQVFSNNIKSLKQVPSIYRFKKEKGS